MQNDTATARRMTWEQYEERVLKWALKRIRARGEPPDKEEKAEASALFGYQAQTVLDCLSSPPSICQRCNAEHQGWETLCYVCSAEQKKSDFESAIRADERAKVLAEQKAAREAEVSAELAQQGEF